ncbi:hypothetical protein RFI_15668 [Reticulomyxa filosa]|uniref:Uncharacterized protein n=1 Tax=Reticulomyxa filosa TaxID=46433 RepID=X6N5I0_RETFI|nr:hypothetical protein RFI_15668 [Reticulomyxa filosa]|eukprot:ETO21535.1 hypothetical protein RFI_15668 [Reticulomyxa filosa]
MSTTTTKKTFQLGAQPHWAGQEENANLSTDLIKSLLNSESANEQLIERGYCLIEVPKTLEGYYSQFHECCETFFKSNKEKEKIKYAQLQFDPDTNSPNQCHGYSAVDTLKEQFMMRCMGDMTSETTYLTTLKTPSCGKDHDFGLVGMKLYEHMDMLCRKLATDVMKQLKKPVECVGEILG